MSSPQLDSWLASLSRFWFRRTPAWSARLRGRRLLLESLEDRFVPSLNLPSLNTLLSTGLSFPTGVAVDSSGNVYIADNGSRAIEELVKSTNTVKILVSFPEVNNPYGVAVDSNGNVYIADSGDRSLKEWVAKSQTVITLATFSSGLFSPTGVAVDGSGNVYIADNDGNAIKEWVASSQTLTTVVSSGLSFPFGVAVDGKGNVYISNTGTGTIEEWVASSQTLTTLGSGLNYPTGVAVDGSGNVYIAAADNGAIDLLTASSQTPITLVSGLSFPYGVAVDGSGNVYIADAGNRAIEELAGLPSITTQPQDATATAGQSAAESFTIADSGGTGPLSVQWQISPDNGNTFINLRNAGGFTGTTTKTLTISGFTGAGASEYRAVVKDADGLTATSKVATLTVNAAPSITTQPQSVIATLDQSAAESFTIAESGGTGPFSVQWQISTNNGGTFTKLSDGNNIAGSTTTTLTQSSFTTPGSTEYRAVVTDANGVIATSNPAILTVNTTSSIMTQPANESATAGQTASESFSVVAANGTGPFTYQWQLSTDGGNTFSNMSDGSGVSGSTTATLSISSNSLPESGTEYRAVLTDANGGIVISSAATLTINAPPSITTQPQNATANTGQSAAESFTIGESGGTAPLGVQWQISTDNGGTFTNLSDGNGIAGSTTATLTLSSFTTAGSPEYRAVITDANGVTTTSNAAILTVNAAPSITTQPQNATATAGQSAAESFTIADSGGTGPLSVQWQISTDNGGTFTNLSDGNGIAGSTTATLTLNGFTTASSPEFRAVVTDANGVSAISNDATLTVNVPPSITTQPQNAAATVGQSAAESFTIAESGGTAPLSVQWQVSTDNGGTFTNLSDGNGVTGSTTTTLTISSFTTAGSAEYQAVVTDANDVAATSNAAFLIVNATPNSGNPNQSWLSQVYADLLHRPLDPSGLATWSSLLNQGMSRAQVVLSIQSSLEYRTDVVEELYSSLLHRPADASGLNAFTSFLGNGATVQQVKSAILGSAEYFQLHGSTNSGFLSAVYQDVLNRSLDASGAQTWALALANGMSRDTVAGAILASGEANGDEVQSLFEAFLHRSADPSGLNSFTTALQQGVSEGAVLAGIVGSDEYFARAQ